jgi:hypothetical protein
MNMKRMRGRNHRSGGGGGGPVRHHGGNIPLNRNHVFDSSGPDLRIRGTAQQLFEKYLQLGRDASGASDRVMAESYFQYAEHYFRVLNAMNQAQQAQQGGQLGGPRRPYGQEAQEQGGEPYQDDQPGLGEQPSASGESREIPIVAAAPED